VRTCTIVSEQNLRFNRKWCMEHYAPTRTNSHSLTVRLTSAFLVNMPRAFSSTLALCSSLTLSTSITLPPPTSPPFSASAIPAFPPSPTLETAETALAAAVAPTVRNPVALAVRTPVAAMEEKNGPCCHGKQRSTCSPMVLSLFYVIICPLF